MLRETYCRKSELGMRKFNSQAMDNYTYTSRRLRANKASADGVRPGSCFNVVGAHKVRGAFVLPESQTTATVEWQ